MYNNHSVVVSDTPAQRVVVSDEALPFRRNRPRNTYRAGVVGFTPVAAATDILALYPFNYNARRVYLERVTISGTATSASVLDVLIQRSSQGGGGTSALVSDGAGARLDRAQSAPSAGLYSYTANRTSNGNGISSDRPLLAVGKLWLGTASVPGNVLDFRFDGPSRPSVNEILEWFVVNLNGQTIPAGCSLNISVEWSEDAIPRTVFAGDSTYSNATELFRVLADSGELLTSASIFNAGSNGFRLQDYLLHTNGVTFPQGGSGNAVLPRLFNSNLGRPGVLVLGYGLNDIRQGLVTQNQLISMIDAAIHATLNGTTSGATYTSPLGAGTTFTWPATTEASPDTRIILHGPNPIATDDPTASNFVSLSGLFAGLTLAQAAAQINDITYNAYQAFANDPRIYRLVQRRDVIPLNRTVAQSGVHTDQGHPNARGQALIARQLTPHLLDALADCQSVII